MVPAKIKSAFNLADDFFVWKAQKAGSDEQQVSMQAIRHNMAKLTSHRAPTRSTDISEMGLDDDGDERVGGSVRPVRERNLAVWHFLPSLRQMDCA